MQNTREQATERRNVDNLEIEPETGWNALYIDGKWVSTGERGSIAVEDPTTRETLTAVAEGTTDDVDEAFAAAEAAQEEWAQRPPQERAAIVSEAGDLLGKYADELATLFAVECGGVQLKADFEIQLAQGTINVGAGLATRASGRRWCHHAVELPAVSN